MSLHRLATPLLAAFTLFCSACDLVLAAPTPDKEESGVERNDSSETPPSSEESSSSPSSSTSGDHAPDPIETGTGTDTSTGGDTTGELDSGPGSSSSGDGSSTGLDTSTSEDGSSSGEPLPPPVDTCTQTDPTTCPVGMCVFSNDTETFGCAGEQAYVPGEVVKPQDAFLRHQAADSVGDLHVIELTEAGTYSLKVVPQDIAYDVGLELYAADGTIIGEAAKKGQDVLEFETFEPGTVALLVVFPTLIEPAEGDYFLTLAPL